MRDSSRLANPVIGSLLAVALALPGCAEPTASRGGPASGPAGGKADDADAGELGEAQRAHLQAVNRCELLAARGRAFTSELRIDARTEIEQERQSCIADANDSVTDTMEATLDAAGSSLAGNAADGLTAWRDAAPDFCELLVDASGQASSKQVSVLAAGCLGQGELHLAEAIQAFVDLGGPPAAGPEIEPVHPACWDQYVQQVDALPEDETALPEQIAATQALGSCVRSDLLNEVALELAVAVVDSFPGRNEDDVLDQTERAFYALAAAHESACMVLGAASVDAGTAAAELQFARCRVSGAIWTGRWIGYAVPELAPVSSDEPADTDDSMSGSTGGGETDDGTTGDSTSDTGASTGSTSG